MTAKNDCTVLDKLAPRYAALVAPACTEHDAAYKEATRRVKAGQQRGSRIPVDLQWASSAATLSGRPWLTLLFLAFLLLGSWWLWYDVDKRLGL